MLIHHHPLLPNAKASEVAAAFQNAFGTTEVDDINLLVGGLSGSGVYKVQANGRDYTLKLNPAADASAGAQRFRKLASAHGVFPPVYYDAEGIVISDFIESQPIRTTFSPEELIAQLAGTISAIHAIPFEGKGKNLFETVDPLIADFQSTGTFYGAVFDECFRHYERLKQVYPLQAADQVFSHNDLNPNNILCDGQRLWIIDWDVASLNNRYVDLANVANFFVHTEEQERNYLSVYFGLEPDTQQTARFFAMRQICRMVYALLMFGLAAKAKPVDHVHNQEMDGIDMAVFGKAMATGLSLVEYEGQLLFGKALLNTALAQMRSPRFIKALSNL